MKEVQVWKLIQREQVPQVAYYEWDKFGTKTVTVLGQDFHLYLGQSWNLKTWDNIGTLDWDNTVFNHVPMYFTAGSMLSQEQNSVIPLLSLVYYFVVPIGIQKPGTILGP